MDVSLFDFDLPPALIAQHPSDRREFSRLLVYDRQTKTITDRVFKDIVEYFGQNDVFVRNNTKVIPARLFGEKIGTGAHVELLLLDDLSNQTYRCLVGNAKVVKLGTKLSFGDGRLKGVCTAIEEEGVRLIQFEFSGIFLEVLESLGEIPLPPYIKEQLKDKDRYQTVYAKVPGSAAAPTAGFHFTEDIFSQLQQKGVTIEEVTLQIGLGTFKPVKVDNITEHHMHYERYQMTESTAESLNVAKKQGKRIVAIGTTTVRTLESNVLVHQSFKAEQTATNIFITPGFKFQAIDALITNFHLPKSTLVMLISALVGREEMHRIYQHAINHQYRFFSFGDAMLIL
jgi:S-adenosylmethionine:tRNA ribosyltransferase-isomerase